MTVQNSVLVDVEKISICRSTSPFTLLSLVNKTGKDEIVAKLDTLFFTTKPEDHHKKESKQHRNLSQPCAKDVAIAFPLVTQGPDSCQD